MAVNIYPVTKCGDECHDYTVKVNGKQIELHSARVSAVPFNRRWPGHQRQIEQTELINFALFETDEAVELEITAPEPFEKLEIRPRTLGITPEIDGQTIRFTLPRAAYFTVEPYDRYRALHIFADPVSDYGVDKEDPNVIYFGPGEHDVGQIDLESGQTLFIDEGAVVYSCISARGADNIRILGRGILDNSRNKEKILYECNAVDNFAAVENAERQHTIQLNYCDNALIDGITIRDSLVYNIRPVCCDGMTIRNVKIIGCWRYNSDGIDSHNCSNMHIKDCFLRTFDDSICVKGMDCWQQPDEIYYNGRVYCYAENILVEGCTVWNDWGTALEIGAETRAEEIRGLTFRDCNIIHLTGPAFGCCNVDRAKVHNVLYENITVEYDEKYNKAYCQGSDDEVYVNPDPNTYPRMVYVSVEYHAEYSEDEERRGENYDFTYRNIHAYGPHPLRIQIVGYDREHKCHGFLFDGLYHNDCRLSDLSQTQLQLVKFAEDVKLK